MANSSRRRPRITADERTRPTRPVPPTARASPSPLLLKPVSCPPVLSFDTLPELYIWIDWIGGKSGFKFGANRVPTGSFDDPRPWPTAGWVNVDYQVEGVTAQMATIPREDEHGGRMIRMNVTPDEQGETSTRQLPVPGLPGGGRPLAGLKVEAKNLIRISVLVRRPIATTPGRAGSSSATRSAANSSSTAPPTPIPAFSRVVLYRKAPADGSFTVTLGLAGYGEASSTTSASSCRGRRGQADPNLASRPAARGRSQPPNPEPSLPSAASEPGWETAEEKVVPVGCWLARDRWAIFNHGIQGF